MKRQSFILIVLISLLAQISFGQTNIVELTCPQNKPTEKDTVVIKYTYLFPTQPCIKDSFATNFSCDTCIKVDVYYNVGDATSPCTDNDSVVIGKLNPGAYSIILNLYSIANPYADSDTITVIVNKTTNLNENIRKESFRIYLNPARNELIISGLKSGLTVQIFNVDGQKIMAVETTGNEQAIDLSNIKDGVYLIRVNNDKKIIFSDKMMVKNTR